MLSWENGMDILGKFKGMLNALLYLWRSMLRLWIGTPTRKVLLWSLTLRDLDSSRSNRWKATGTQWAWRQPSKLLENICTESGDVYTEPSFWCWNRWIQLLVHSWSKHHAVQIMSPQPCQFYVVKTRKSSLQTRRLAKWYQKLLLLLELRKVLIKVRIPYASEGRFC